MTSYRLIPLDDTVVFPGMPVTLTVDPGAETRVLLVPRRGDAFAKVGVVAEVTERVKLAGRRHAVTLIGLHRAQPGAASSDADGQLRVDVEERPDITPPPALTRELEREYRAVVEELLQLRGDDGRISAFLRSISGASALADTAGYSPDISVEHKIDLLETLDVVERLTLAVKLQKERLTELQLRKRIRDDVDSGAQKQQREYFLHKQMDAIRKELGQNEASVAEEYRKKIAAAGMPEKVQQQAERELSRFERMGDANAESSMIRTYLDWLLAVPWSK
jgi:ATP-dependent Lon protease